MPRDFRGLDARFADGFREARIAAGLSQEKVADEMRALGFDMSQPVVGKLERGDRKVSIGEAEALASIVGVRLYQLEAGPSNVKLEHAVRHFDTLVQGVREAIDRFRSGQVALAMLADEIGLENLAALDVETIAWNLDMSPADIVRSVELGHIEENVGRRAREDIEAGEDRYPGSYEAGFLSGFLARNGDTIDRTASALGLDDALRSFSGGGGDIGETIAHIELEPLDLVPAPKEEPRPALRGEQSGKATDAAK